MSKQSYAVCCYTCEHNGQETCKGCNTILNGENEPYENWELREDLCSKDQKIADLQHRLEVAEKALEMACETMRYELGRESIKNLYKDAMKNLKNNLNMKIDKEMCQWYLEQAEKELKGEQAWKINLKT